MAKKNEQPTTATPIIQVCCIIALVILFIVSAITKTEVPLIVYALIAGTLFGVSNLKTFLRGFLK